MPSLSPTLYVNPSAISYVHSDTADLILLRKFHNSLPNFAETSLTPLPELATELGVKAVFVKDENGRLGLPAFKILGASWGVFRAIAARAGFALDTPLPDIAGYAQSQELTLLTATDGNHGRAVARMAKILGIKATVFVPRFTDEATRGRIRSEGAELVGVHGDYDAAVARAYEKSKEQSDRGLFVQDTSFEGYEEIPRWIVEGYSTMLQEVETQLRELNLKATVMVTPIGVGSLGNAVVAHCKSGEREIGVLAIEPETSACLNASLRAGQITKIETGTTIMDGMNCGTVSPISWPALKDGVDVSVTISDLQSHDAVKYLHSHDVKAGPCGAGTLAGLRKVAEVGRDTIRLNKESVVVLLCTEGEREYVIPDGGID